MSASTLRPNARPFDFELAVDDQIGPWQRACRADADVVEHDEPGVFTVELSDDVESHACYFVETDGTFYGWCSCDEFQQRAGPCAHLCSLRRLTFVDEVSVPVVERPDRDVDVVEEGPK
jgi:hypothetical protein